MILDPELGLEAKVKISEFGGVRNQFTIKIGPNSYFQSYNSIIVMIDAYRRVYLDINYWDYSRTTGKYRNKWLGETKRETEKKIKLGIYRLIDLNK